MTPTPPVEIASELDRLRARAAELARERDVYRTLVEASPYCIKLIDTDGRLLSMNRAGLDMLGESEESAIIGRDFLAVVCEEDLDRVRGLLERALAGAGAEFEFRARVGLDFRSSLAPIRDDDGTVTALISITQDVTERRRAEEALRTSEERFRLLSLATRDAFYDWDLRTDIVWRNRVYQQIYGVSELQPGRVEWWERHVHPDERAELVASVHRALEGGDDHWAAEYRIRRLDGGWASVVDRALIERDASGAALRIIGAMTDITERHRAEQHRRLLVNELDHRVKNNLAAVLALAEQTRGSARSLDEFTHTFEGRIRALARSHEALAATRWNGIELHEMLRIAMDPYVPDDRPVTISGDSLLLPPRASGALTLALHELTTNAIKHGAWSRPGGRIELESRHGGDDTLHLHWRELGGPAPAAPFGPGVGTALIRGFIEHELHGTLELAPGPEGLVCRMVIPLGDLRVAPDRAGPAGGAS